MRLPRVPLLALAASAALAAPAAAQTVIFQDDFESGLGNWIATGLWNPESSIDPCGAENEPFPDGTQAAYWGIDGQCDYNVWDPLPSGTLTLATPVSLPLEGPRATLRFRYVLEIENNVGDGCYDFAYVRVQSTSGYVLAFAGCDSNEISPGPSPGWHEFAADITPLLGQDVTVEFTAYAGDILINYLYGWLVDDVRIELEAGSASCRAPCPCNNAVGLPPYDRTVGCRNSRGTGGLLTGHGSPSVALDSLVLTASGLPPTTMALFFQGTLEESVPMGDGLRCAGGGIIRLGGGQASGGVVAFPGPASPTVAHQGDVPPGASRIYQVFYRDNPSFCTPAAFNLTNAYTIAWAP